MAISTRSIMQFRYDDTTKVAYPDTLERTDLTEGNIFMNKSIIQLGIQATPGTKFYLNQENVLNNQENNYIIIGNSGMYELNVEGWGQITSIQFVDSTLRQLIIDIVYETLI
jgi:hypothetical protein